VLIIQSHGGVAPVADAVRLAAGAVLSGPAGGVAGSRYCARLLGEGNLIPFDMGGTSTDISLVEHGEAHLSPDRAVAGQKVALPSLDIVSIGAGGGSIARVDAGAVASGRRARARSRARVLRQGGTAATVTDAIWSWAISIRELPGRPDPARPRGRAAAVDTIAERLGTERMVAAEGIHRVINTVMAEHPCRVGAAGRRSPAVRASAFGGAAALHVTDVARRLEIGRVVVPRVAAVLSAWGMLATDLRYEAVRTHIGDARRVGAAQLRQVFAAMETEGRRRLAEAFSGPVRIQRAVDMRYGEQIFEVNVSLGDVDLEAPDAMSEISRASTSATRSSTPTRRRTRRSSSSTRAWRWWARTKFSVFGMCAGRRPRLKPPSGCSTCRS
jgi:N-methylhydantoinase A